MKFARLFVLVASALALVWSSGFAQSFGPTYTQDVVQLKDGTYYNVAGHFKCDQYGAPIVTEESPIYTVGGLQGVCANQALVGHRFLAVLGSGTVGNYRSMDLHVQWNFGTDTTYTTQDSLGLEIIPMGKISQSFDGNEYTIDLDPQTPGVQGVYITRTRTPVQEYGFGVDSVRAVFSSGSTAVTWGNWVKSSVITNNSYPAGSYFISTDSSAASTDRFLKVSSANQTGCTLSGNAPTSQSWWNCGFYLFPSIVVYADAPWQRFYQSTGSNNGPGYDKIDQVSFPLCYRNGAPVQEEVVGFYILNHTNTSVNVSIDIWPKAN